MSYSFGTTSRRRLETCHPKLKEILNEAIKYIDFSVLCGTRDKAAQDEAVAAKASKVEYPNSRHNTSPSMAVDIAPWPIDWDDAERFGFLQGIIRGIALMKGINIRSGIDWDGDGDITDHQFMDWPHIELLD